MSRPLAVIAAAPIVLALLTGCRDTTSPRDLVPPAAPRGVVSVTGDGKAYLSWYANTESDVAGYRIYEGNCEACEFERIGTTTTTQFTAAGLVNGVTRHFAVAAFDRNGNESELSHDEVFDTPRPEGWDARVTDAALDPLTSGWDFSAAAVRPWDHESVDVYYSRVSGVDRMVAPFEDTEIQDAGYTNTIDGVDFAPVGGWAPSGIVELVVGHSYIVRTHDNHYAKFRVTRLSGGAADFDWAYQVDPGNRELRARPASREGARIRRALAAAP
jgi:hypothetical protein